jgi:hypothetical protein
MPSDRYGETFNNAAARATYEDLSSKAKTVVRLPFSTPTEAAFLRAGEVVVEMSDLLIAVWDGKPARGLGGTADVVRYSLDQGTPVFHINPISQTTGTYPP